MFPVPADVARRASMADAKACPAVHARPIRLFRFYNTSSCRIVTFVSRQVLRVMTLVKRPQSVPNQTSRRYSKAGGRSAGDPGTAFCREYFAILVQHLVILLCPSLFRLHLTSEQHTRTLLCVVYRYTMCGLVLSYRCILAAGSCRS